MVAHKDARGCIGEGAAEDAELPEGVSAALREGLYCARGRFRTLQQSKPHESDAFAAATMPIVRQLPEQSSSCGRQIATLETCVLPDGTEKRGAEVTFRESAEGGVRCVECAGR